MADVGEIRYMEISIEKMAQDVAQKVIQELRDNGIFVSKWTPVSEGLPDIKEDEQKSDFCFCCDKDGYITIGWIATWSVRRPDGTIYCGKDWHYVDEDEVSIDIVAWMPLPKPYKPKESEDTKNA